MITNSIRFKTSVLYSSILCAILVCFSLYLFHAVRSILYRNVADELNLKAEQIAGTINAYGEVTRGKMPPMSLMRQFLSDSGEVPVEAGVIDKLWEKHRWILGEHQDLFRVVDMKGEVVLQSEDLPAGAGLLFDRYLSVKSGLDNFGDLKLNGAPFRVIRYPFTFDYRRPLILQLAVPMGPVQSALSRLVMVMITGILGILVMSLFIGAFLTRRILKPVTVVTQTANNISQRNLGVRIPEQALDNEMRLLVDSFNQMIDRLEKSFTHINEFSSHVAHELKTPLAIIKGELEVALSGDNIRDEDRRVMTVALQETDRLIRIIKDLLLIAKFDYRQDIFKMEKMDLTAFLKDISQHSRILASEKNISLDLTMPEQPIGVQGDAVHLRRLFFNLIHNAVKFTPADGKINIVVTPGEGEVRVAVKDTGEGIAPEDQPRIFEKFYRGRKADRSDTPGTGLGLCLARSIARAHGGDITFESIFSQGSTFTVTLPS